MMVKHILKVRETGTLVSCELSSGGLMEIVRVTADGIEGRANFF
jgi:hypothetical protein